MYFLCITVHRFYVRIHYELTMYCTFIINVINVCIVYYCNKRNFIWYNICLLAKPHLDRLAVHRTKCCKSTRHTKIPMQLHATRTECVRLWGENSWYIKKKGTGMYCGAGIAKNPPVSMSMPSQARKMAIQCGGCNLSVLALSAL